MVFEESVMDYTSPSGSRSNRLFFIVIAALSAVALVAVMAWTLAPRASVASGQVGPYLSIAVVPPVEPVPDAGEVLDVGMLNDGFDRAALERQAEVAATDDLPPEAYVGEVASTPEPVTRRYTSRPQPASSDVAIITSTDPLADGSRLFGFDRASPLANASVATIDSPDLQTPPATASQSFFQ